MAQAVIFGAGKIARGFLGHLMFRSGVTFAFIEKADALVELMRSRGRYTVRVLGAPDKGDVVTGFRVYSSEDREGIRAEMRDAEAVFTAVGGKNLTELSPVIGFALSCADRAMNVITCENWKDPARILEERIRPMGLTFPVGFAESVVMRSAIEPDPEDLARDPLTVNVQDYWRLPVDASKLVAPLIKVEGIEPMDDFAGFLERKFYTYNAANGTVSYLGALLGYKRIADAAWDERVAGVLEMVYQETGRALASKHGMSLEKQLEFAATSRTKLRDRVIVDNIERNARDPLRKLGPGDRLVGPARLCERYGVTPEGIATAIAAAIHYQSPGDPSAEQLQAMRSANGTAYVLKTVCMISPDEPLGRLVLNKEREIADRGWLK